MESRTRQGCRALLNDAYLLPLILSGLRAYTLSLYRLADGSRLQRHHHGSGRPTRRRRLRSDPAMTWATTLVGTLLGGTSLSGSSTLAAARCVRSHPSGQTVSQFASAPPSCAPVRSAPPSCAPVRSAPPSHASVRSAPPSCAPVRFAPSSHAPVRSASSSYASVRFAPPSFAPVRFAPSNCVPVRSAPPSCACVRSAPLSRALVRFAPPRFASRRSVCLRSRGGSFLWVGRRPMIVRAAWMSGARLWSNGTWLVCALALCSPGKGGG